MSQSITVKSCKLKKETDTFKVYGVEDIEGNKYDAFKELKEGESYNVEITPNGNYAPKLKVIDDRKNTNGFKGGWGGQKSGNESFSLAYAKDLACANIAQGKPFTSEDVIKVAEKFYQWLESKRK